MSLLYELAVQEDLNIGTDDGISVTGPDGGTLTGTQVGIHSFAVGQVAWTKTWNPAAILTLSYEDTDIVVPGAAVGDFVMASLSTMLTNDMQLTGHVSAADTVKAVLFNPTTGTINLDSGTLSVLVFKSR
jgi:hypothetical protein